MTSSSFKKTIKSLKTCLLDHDPVTYGVCPIPAKDFKLFYGKNDTARQLDLHTASDAELELLARACTAATFGMNQQDVYDETYRKAGKMDTEEFSSKFDLERSGILTRIRDDLLDHTNYGRPVEWELYKLNVYGIGGFFKAHKDTPRGANMFGSLVIVFPTKHSAGELKLRHGGKEWTFNSAKELAAATEPSIGYIAFFSDVEHEVAVVQSGYRVTLTYNLYFGETPVSPPEAMITNVVANREHTFKAGLEQLLADPTFLPNGGLVGFGLQHKYPVNAETKLCSVMECLKGNDALVRKVCQQLSLPIKPKMLTHDYGYFGDKDEKMPVDSDGSENSGDENGQCDEGGADTTRDSEDDSMVGDSDGGEDDGESDSENHGPYDPHYVEVLTDHVVDLSQYGGVETSAGDELAQEKGALILSYPDGTPRERWDAKKGKKVKYSVDIQWITESTSYNEVKTQYVALGNEASLEYLYGTVCLVAEIGLVGKRTRSEG
ncbi:uncharacterized protein LOC129585604 [Paramacrobiotus metropolitanus]|uniref:uncharacterized protein LOC129585604 n=1 Tax=Paramacrobiotus metropolitanus TaxID=2943436 RepID=UPI002445C154|nr:uncharacterized protein LOC129585604 [Paramacrobiotus metropolitanus]